MSVRNSLHCHCKRDEKWFSDESSASKIKIPLEENTSWQIGRSITKHSFTWVPMVPLAQRVRGKARASSAKECCPNCSCRHQENSWTSCRVSCRAIFDGGAQLRRISKSCAANLELSQEPCVVTRSASTGPTCFREPQLEAITRCLSLKLSSSQSTVAGTKYCFRSRVPRSSVLIWNTWLKSHQMRIY